MDDANAMGERGSLGGNSTDTATEIMADNLSNQDVASNGNNEGAPPQSLASESQGLMFYVRRLSIPFGIVAMSTLFPDVNLILSLLGGSICGVCFIVMPVFFYR